MHANDFIAALEKLIADEADRQASLEAGSSRRQAALAALESRRNRLWQTIIDAQLESGNGSWISGELKQRVVAWQAEREGAEKQLRQNMTSLTARLEKQRQAWQQAVTARDALQACHAANEAALTRSLQADEHGTALRDASRNHAQKVDDLQRRLDEAEAEKHSKIQAYQADPFFMHLHARGYGTQAYRCPFGTGLFDRWLARLIGYDRVCEYYDLLTEMPRWLHEKLSSEKRLAQATGIEYEARLVALRKPDDVSVRAELEQADAQCRDEEQALADLKQAQRQQKAAQDEFDGQLDTFSTRIRQACIKACEGWSHDELLQATSATVTAADGDAAWVLGELVPQWEQAEKDARKAMAACHAAADRHQQLQTLHEALVATGAMTADYTIEHAQTYLDQLAVMLGNTDTFASMAERILEDVQLRPGGLFRRKTDDEAFPGSA